MYKVGSRKAQASVSRASLSDLTAPHALRLTAEQERDSLKSRMKQVEAELLELPRRDPRRKELGLMKLDLQNQMSAIRRKCVGPRGLSEFFMDVCREALPRLQFNQLYEQAHTAARLAGVEFDNAPHR